MPGFRELCISKDQYTDKSVSYRYFSPFLILKLIFNNIPGNDLIITAPFDLLPLSLAFPITLSRPNRCMSHEGKFVTEPQTWVTSPFRQHFPFAFEPPNLRRLWMLTSST